MINIVFNGSSQLSLIALPLLVCHPTQILLGEPPRPAAPVLFIFFSIALMSCRAGSLLVPLLKRWLETSTARYVAAGATARPMSPSA
jgi:hypothetical protein